MHGIVEYRGRHLEYVGRDEGGAAVSADECACTMCCECLDRVEFSPDGTIGGREAEKTLEAKVSADIQRWFAERAVIEAAKAWTTDQRGWLKPLDEALAQAVDTLRELEGEV